jgi:steroid delta-isomerase-like uncharacterized protein
MASRNVEILAASHEAFNRRDFDAIANIMTEDVVYHDRARGVVFRGREEFKQFLQGWATAFSDARVSEPTYIDAGDMVVTEFRGRGTNDGPMGPLPPTGKQLDCPFCEMFRFNAKGQIVSGGIYYDQLTIMMQLGHAAQGQASGRP